MGEDITQNARTLRTLPTRLNGAVPDRIEIRGEVFMPKRGFDAMNARLAAEVKNLCQPAKCGLGQPSTAGSLDHSGPAPDTVRLRRRCSFGRMAGGEPF